MIGVRCGFTAYVIAAAPLGTHDNGQRTCVVTPIRIGSGLRIHSRLFTRVERRHRHTELKFALNESLPPVCTLTIQFYYDDCRKLLRHMSISLLLPATHITYPC